MYQEKTLDIIQALHDSISFRGFKATLDILQINKEPLLTDFEKTVIDEVSKALNISNPMNVILDNRNLRGDSKMFIEFCVFYWYSDTSITQIHKRILRNKSLSQITLYKNNILNLNQNYQQDEKYYHIREKLNETLLQK